MNDKGLIVYKTLHETVTYLSLNKLPKGTYVCRYLSEQNNYWVFGTSEPLVITAPGYLEPVGLIPGTNKLYRLVRNEDI